MQIDIQTDFLPWHAGYQSLPSLTPPPLPARAYPKAYREAWVALSLPRLLAPYVRLEALRLAVPAMVLWSL
jgi:hypothetical protein